MSKWRCAFARQTTRALAWCLLLLSACAPRAWAQEVAGCGNLANAFGPWDYRADKYVPPPGDNMSHGEKRRLVDSAHFTPPVENLIKGNAGYLGGDLDYTLRAFPNHHRALVSVAAFGEKTKLDQPPNMRYSVECYFRRALAFKPDDTVARLLFSNFLIRKGRLAEAEQQIDIAQRASDATAFTHYNIGLLYLDMKKYDQALAQAHLAQRMGFARPELRDRLNAAGQWKEPSSTDATAPVDAPASAASGG